LKIFKFSNQRTRRDIIAVISNLFAELIAKTARYDGRRINVAPGIDRRSIYVKYLTAIGVSR
jgi:hypothetical protein